MSFDEKKYYAKNGVCITYVEDPYPVENVRGESKMLVVFQSLGDEKSTDPVKRYPYTLLSGLRYFNCRKVYIKDDNGLVGDYYLGVNGGFDTKNAVIEFLKEKIKEHKLLSENLIFMGFSKGGFAALLFAHELKINTVISAVPQFDLVKWIDNYKPHLSYIYPENASVEQKSVYSDYLYNCISTSLFNPKKIYLITSRNDDTYSDHIPRLIEVIKEQSESKLCVYYNDDYYVTQHNNVVRNSFNEIMAVLSYELISNDVKEFFSDNK